MVIPTQKHSKNKVLFYNKSVLGQALFVSITCRPDVATAVSQCGKYAQSPSLEHWRALLRIVAYLNSTKDYQLQLGGKCSQLNFLL